MQKHIIWSNVNLNLDDWKDFLEEEYPDVTDEYEQCKLVSELNDEYLGDERANCDIHTEGRIVAIADLGLWNGRRQGYKLLDHNINDCLCLEESCDYAEFYCDSYDLKSIQHHHDGSHYITYREFKPGITSDQADSFCWKLYEGKATRKDITRYTRSLKPYVNKVYGWR